MQVVILAGGRGERISHLSVSSPKPLIKINNKPFLGYLLEQIHIDAISDVLILTGYKSEQIEKYISYVKKNFSYNIKLFKTPDDYNTGARILSAKKELSNRFLLLYADNYLPINFSLFLRRFKNKKSCIISGYKNNDEYSKSNLKINYKKSKLRVLKYNNNIKNFLNHVDIGYCFLNKNHLPNIDCKDTHLGKNIFSHLISKKNLYLHEVHQRYYTVGTRERILAFRDFISQRKNKYIFIDRDGVINKKPKKGEYVTNPNEFIFEENALLAFKILQKKKYLPIIISNQAGIARGLLSEKNLRLIHEFMCNQIRINGGNVTAIYYCPHHWDDKCDCRKPAPGMLKNAAKDFGIDLSKTIFIGDSKSDQLASYAVDSQFIKVSKTTSLYDIVKKLD